MSNDNDTSGLHLSRRKALAGIGGIGVASAGAGLGTSAFFSDAETFEGNSISAGELQLYGSYQQIYYGPEENSDHYEPYGEAGKPWVSAYPDDNEDGIQSYNGEAYVDDPGSDGPEDGANISVTCEDFDEMGGAPSPVIDLDDVKPGDKGEVTFGLTLCDNPGYLWMQSDLTEEEDVPDNDEEHLLDFLQARVWYDDDCDNVRDGCVDTDLMMTIDMSGSMFYDQYGGVVSDDPIDIDGDGNDEYDETTTIDMVEKALFEFVSETIEKLEEEEETDEGGCDINVGIVFFNGYDDGPNIETVDFTDGSIAELEALIDSGGDLRELREQVADLTGGPDEPDGDAGDIDTGTALEEGVDEAEAILDEDGDTDNRQNVLVTDGAPWIPGDISREDFEGALRAADDARSDGETSICVLGDTAGEDDGAIFTQQTMAGSAGTGITDVDEAADAAWEMWQDEATLDDYDPEEFGGDLSFWFDLQDPDAATELFAKKGASFLGEPIIAEGTMREVLDDLNSDGIELHTTPLLGNGGCFPAEELICLGFEWEFPPGQEDVNDAQGDSLTFDLSFYTEQCRHNDNPTGLPTAGD